jgi:hypothetical protein
VREREREETEGALDFGHPALLGRAPPTYAEPHVPSPHYLALRVLPNVRSVVRE